MKITLLTFIFINSFILAQPELKMVRALPHLYNVTNAPNTNTYFAAGENGAILRSSDAGNTWFGTFSVLQNTVTSIFFINENTGWAVTAFGKIARTDNSGANWEMVAEINNAPFRDVAFVDENSGYAAGANVIFKTTDGGYTWNQSYINNSIFIQRISAPSVNYCWAACNDGYLYRTSNGGANWIELVSGTSGHIMAVNFINNQTGWYTGSNVNATRKTTNGGVTWSFVPVTFPGPWNIIKFFDTTNGYIGGAKVSMTSDGGQNWMHTNPYSNWIMNSTCFRNMNSGVSVSGYGLITKTSNGGINWSIEQFGHNGIIRAISFAEDIFGWGLYDNSLLVQTSDRGVTWSENTALLDAEVRDIFFMNSSTGWACTNKGKFHKTTNGGLNWIVSADFGETYHFEKILFVSSQRGFSFMLPGALYYTLNGGSSWFLNNTFPNEMTDISFANVGTGWLTGKRGMIYRTTNSGASWDDQSAGIIGNVNTISVIDPNTCFAGGTKLYKTINGGVNWTLVNNDNLYRFKELFFSGINTAWGIDSIGKIIYTSNGGSNWYQYPNPYYMSFWCANSNNNTCWFGGNFGTIVTNSQVVGINAETSEIPDKFNFGQNYPNPFNPKTRFQFDLPKKEFIKLRIYDINGKLITELVNNLLSPGIYSVDWDAGNFSSGVYFAVLNLEKTVHSRKIILLK